MTKVMSYDDEPSNCCKRKVKRAGYTSAIMRVLAAELLRVPQVACPGFIVGLKQDTRRHLAQCLRHPEAALIDPSAVTLAERVEAGPCKCL